MTGNSTTTLMKVPLTYQINNGSWLTVVQEGNNEELQLDLRVRETEECINSFVLDERHSCLTIPQNSAQNSNTACRDFTKA